MPTQNYPTERIIYHLCHSSWMFHPFAECDISSDEQIKQILKSMLYQLPPHEVEPINKILVEFSLEQLNYDMLRDALAEGLPLF